MMGGKLPSIFIQALFLLALTLFPSPVFAALPTQGEDLKAKADALYDEGVFLFSQGDYQVALDRLEEALAIYQDIGDREGEGGTLNNLGVIYSTLGQYPQALDYYRQALAIRREIGDRPGEDTTLYNIGLLYIIQGQYAQALDYFKQALAIAQELGDRAAETARLNNIGAVYDFLGQYPQALDYYQQALAVSQEVDQREVKTVKTLTNIALIYRRLGQSAQALDYFQQALATSQELGDQVGEGATLDNIGQVYKSLGQYRQALDYYQQALVLRQEIGDQEGEAISLADIGTVYDGLGQYPQALDYYQRALAISQELGDRVSEGSLLANIGTLYTRWRQYTQALDYYQRALAISQEIRDRETEVGTLNNIGVVYRSQGQYPQAIDYFQQALALLQEVGNRQAEGQTLNDIGMVYHRLEQYPQALDYYQRSLAIRQEIGDRVGENETIQSIGLLHEQQGDNAQAIAHYQQATEILESIRGDIKVEELKAMFAARHAYIYEHLIGLLWDEGRFQEAFNYAERARARAFLDGLVGGAINFRAGTDSTLLAREQTLKAEIAGLHTQLFILRNHPANEWNTEAIAAVEAEITAREADYVHILTELKIQSPEVASLVNLDVASLADIQGLLDTTTTLVEYFVTQEHAMAFIITRETFETVTLEVSRDSLTQTITTFSEFASLNEPHPNSLKQLHAWLISPLKDKLKTPVVGIIPHGVLHYLPFAALTDGTRYVSDEYSLFTLPSASVMRFIQEKRKPTISTILALGNPTTTEPGLAPLRFAQQEVETITNIFGTHPLVGDLATESTLRSQAGSASIIHLAAHGQYNSFNPLFSVIYLVADQKNDGRLEANEIYSLDLTSATDLVVLSACQTNVGAVTAGDEVVGLTRAFLYAGTPTVIASLWNVDDEATTLLMERFYKHLQEGMSKAQALQQAQREVRSQYPHPYYWAAFVLTGDPGTTAEELATGKSLADALTSWGVWIVLGLLVIIGAGLILRISYRKFPRSSQNT